MDSETWQEDEHIKSTVGNREMGTGISEASKRVPIFFMMSEEAGKRVSIFDRGTGSKPARLRQAQIQLPAG